MSRKPWNVTKQGDQYHFDEPHGALTSLVYVDGNGDCYIEPCGGAPGGYFFPASQLQRLLDLEIVVPHAYDCYPGDGRYEAIMAEGVAFDVMGAADGDINEYNWAFLENVVDQIKRYPLK